MSHQGLHSHPSRQLVVRRSQGGTLPPVSSLQERRLSSRQSGPLLPRGCRHQCRFQCQCPRSAGRSCWLTRGSLIGWSTDGIVSASASLAGEAGRRSATCAGTTARGGTVSSSQQRRTGSPSKAASCCAVNYSTGPCERTWTSRPD